MAATLLDSPTNVHRAVTLRYGLSLSAVALLTVLGWLLMNAQLTVHKQQDDTVALSGAQRMLTHQMAGLVAEDLGNENGALRAHTMADLTAAEGRYLDSFHTLSARTTKQALTTSADRDLHAAYFEGGDSVSAATARIEHSLQAVEAGNMSRPDAQALIDWMRGPVITVLNRAVAAHRSIAKRTLRDLRAYHVLDLAGVLLVLLIEALFIFAPLARRLARQTTEMHAQSLVLMETSRELDRLASTDGLTRLANRRALDRALAGSATWIAERPRPAHTRPAAGTAVISFDLDCFKQVNDVHGHAAGDAVLRAVGERLRAVCRGGDLVARMGGDEFTAILYDVPSSEFVEVIAERIRSRVAEPVFFEGKPLVVGASIGTCLVPEQASNLQDALKIADDLQREAKQQSKSRSARRQTGGAPTAGPNATAISYSFATAWPETVR